MTKRRLWNREELLLAINLYCKTPFGKMHNLNPDIINLSKLLHRTPSAVAWKLVNFASLDPSLKARGIKGAVNSSKLDKKIWLEFYNNWENLAEESELLLLETQKKYSSVKENVIKFGKEKERVVKTRMNQSFFRETILASYDGKCCITGIYNSELLIAGHIVPWAIDERNRLNPRNGILLNALHDKAFENGLITITPNYKIKVCKNLLNTRGKFYDDFFKSIHEKEILLPSRFLPDIEFLKYHNENRFRQ